MMVCTRSSGAPPLCAMTTVGGQSNQLLRALLRQQWIVGLIVLCRSLPGVTKEAAEVAPARLACLVTCGALQKANRRRGCTRATTAGTGLPTVVQGLEMV